MACLFGLTDISSLGKLAKPKTAQVFECFDFAQLSKHTSFHLDIGILIIQCNKKNRRRTLKLKRTSRRRN